MDKVAKKYKRQLKYMEYVETFFKEREDRDITVAEYTDFDHKAKLKFNHYSDCDYLGR